MIPVSAVLAASEVAVVEISSVSALETRHGAASAVSEQLMPAQTSRVLRAVLQTPQINLASDGVASE